MAIKNAKTKQIFEDFNTLIFLNEAKTRGILKPNSLSNVSIYRSHPFTLLQERAACFGRNAHRRPNAYVVRTHGYRISFKVAVQ